jgi:hypothetical protein
VQDVVFSYSDVSYSHVMRLSAIVNAAGADFRLLGAARTMLASTKPVVAVCAVRTGSGKSQTTRRVAQAADGQGLRVVAVRHPMPYGDLAAQKVQRFATSADLAKHKCTIEEMEEYEPHIAAGTVVYAGVDYGASSSRPQAEADVILWDGGNNDLPFYRPTCTSSSPTRCAPATSSPTTRRGQPADGRRGDHQQDRQRQPEAVQQVYANIRAVNPRRSSSRPRRRCHRRPPGDHHRQAACW